MGDTEDISEYSHIYDIAERYDARDRASLKIRSHLRGSTVEALACDEAVGTRLGDAADGEKPGS